MTDAPTAEEKGVSSADFLPPRQETFLARYPRKMKLGVTGVLLFSLLTPWFWHLSQSFVQHGTVPHHDDVSASTEHPPVPTETLAPVSVQDLLPPLPEKIVPREFSESEKEAIERNDRDDKNSRLAAAPDPEMIEGDGSDGYLPIVSKDGRLPWQVYARPFDHADKRPRISIIITGLGLSRVATDATIQRLPAAITLAFDVHSPLASSWMTRARDDGHETLLSVPMEPFDFPRSDPGPNTLLSSITTDDNLQRLTWALKRGTGYIGILAAGNSRMATDQQKIMPILKEIKKRGLFVLETHPSKQSTLQEITKELQVPLAVSSQKIDTIATAESIDSVLGYLEQSARISGRAIGMASPLPLTLDRLTRWSQQLASRGIVLAPISAMAE